MSAGSSRSSIPMSRCTGRHRFLTVARHVVCSRKPGATHGAPCNRPRLSAGWSRASWRRARRRSSCSGAREASPRPETALTGKCWACITSVGEAHPRPDVLLRYRGVGQLLGEGQGPSDSAAAVNWREAMQAIALCLSTYTMLYVRLALGITFLAAVTDRFGLWGPPGTRNVAWGNFDNFLCLCCDAEPLLFRRPGFPRWAGESPWPRWRAVWP